MAGNPEGSGRGIPTQADTKAYCPTTSSFLVSRGQSHRSLILPTGPGVTFTFGRVCGGSALLAPPNTLCYSGGLPERKEHPMLERARTTAFFLAILALGLITYAIALARWSGQ